MATKEIITLSSDEESDCDNQSELRQNIPSNESVITNKQPTSTSRWSHSWIVTSKNAIQLNSSKSMQANIQKNFYEIYHKPMIAVESKKDDIIIIDEDSNKNNFNVDNTPELVDLEECNDINEITNNDIKPNIQNISNDNHFENVLIEHYDNDMMTVEQCLDFRSWEQTSSNDNVILVKKVKKKNSSTVNNKEINIDDDDTEIPEFFHEFVKHCSSLERNKNDRARLIKKLEKRCREADPKYVKSDKFRTLVNESKGKINKNNLYLIAKEVTDELSLRKRIEIKKEQNGEEVTNKKGQVISEEEKKSKKKKKMVNKIIKKLDKLGTKIRELEEAEVDLSDEEESSYILVQRYREKFCQIYKKLCEVMNEPSDANRVFCRKICFSGSKYPAINQCIEKWLNKTKRFPDFNDIVKLLENQSSSLGLPSNKELIRATATEIFQEVGKMLQRRRKHDLWDCLGGFLNDDKDPALADSNLDEVLKKNFDDRVKKEQEIFRHYAELQEKERLEPEEVPEEEANLSPIESGNEDEEEIEGIEKSLNERLDVTIEREHNLKESDYIWDEGDKNVAGVESLPQSNNLPGSVKETETPTHVKESKNNYKNCKSIKYRGENRSKSNEDSSSSKNGFEETKHKDGDKNPNDKTMETKEAEKRAEAISSEGGAYNESTDVDVVSVGSNETEAECSALEKFDFSKIPVVTLTRLPHDMDFNNVKLSGDVWINPKSDKREMTFEDDTPSSVKKRKTDSQVPELDFKNDMEEVFKVHRCEIEHDFVDDIFNFRDDLTEKRKHWDKRKIFKDLTNVGRLMELNGKKRKSSGYFSHSIYHPGFPDFAKFSWKKRFRLTYKFVGLKGQKCALSQDDKDSKSVGGDGKDSNGKGVENNSESGGDDGSNFFIGGGSGSEKDNDENDENKGGEKTKDFSDDAKHDEDEEDEEETEDELGGIDGKKPEEETPVDDSFNCSADDQTASFNELDTTPPDRTTTDGEENEIEEIEEINESDEAKSDKYCENFMENRVGELEGNISSGDEPIPPTNLQEDEIMVSDEEPEKSEEPEAEINIDKVDDHQIEEQSNEIGQDEERINDVKEEKEDLEAGEQQDNEEDLETREQQDNKENVEVKKEEGEFENVETGEQQDNEEVLETGEQQDNEENIEVKREEGEFENVETGEEQGKDLDEDSTEKQNEEDSAKIKEEKIKEEDAETGGQQETDVNLDSIKKEKKKENLNSEEVQVKEEEREVSEIKDEDKRGRRKSRESIELKEAESSCKMEKPLIRLRNLAEMEARINPRMIQRIEPRIDPRMNMRLQSRYGLIMEPGLEPRMEQRLEPRIEQRLEARMDQRLEQRLGPRMEQIIEPRMDQRLEQRLGPRMEQIIEPRLGPRMEQGLEARMDQRLGPRIEQGLEARMDQRLGPRIEQRLEPRPGLIIDPRGGLRLEPRAGFRLEPRAGLRLEPRGGLRLEPRAGPRMEMRAGMRIEPRLGLRIEPRPELRGGMGVEPRAGMGVEPRAGLGIELRIDPRVETRIEQMFERSPLGCKNKRENVVRREINQGNQVNATTQIFQVRPVIDTSQRRLSARQESSYHGGQDSEIEFLGQKIGRRRKTTRSPTDEERVKKFLMHSPSSISIIPPKKLSLSKPPSQAALQALETLKGLKGISATRVKGKESKPEDDVVVIGESYVGRPQTARKSTSGLKRRNDLPVISSVHSIHSPSATGSTKIQVFHQGNVSGFPGSSQPTTLMASAATAAAAAAAANHNRIKNGPPVQPNNNDSSSIRISSVWGSMPQTAVYSRSMSTPGISESSLPGCSFQNNSSSAGGGGTAGGEGGPTTKKKKKPVEFVVLE